MKVSVTSSIMFIACFLMLRTVAAQQASDTPLNFPKHVDSSVESEDGQRYTDMINRNITPHPRGGPTAEAPALKSGPLAPSEQDRANYAAFLKEPNTGLIRLLPQRFFDGRKEDLEKRMNIRGGGRFYSFYFRSHNYGVDLELEADTVCKGVVGASPECQHPRKLRVGSSGFLTNLGDVSLAEITLTDQRMTFILGYKPPREIPQARCDDLMFRKGVIDGGKLYKNDLPIEVNSSYILRSIDWQSDVLVAFRVVREDSDGALTIAWKLLKQFPRRRLENVLYLNPIDKCPTR